ncbi:glucosyltransferase domain-containing protein [uncultured Clostridium sp.]|uniref:glucosyltransferase domain-containing protein n=1 Tax=uncultured Clostridium sp. TaxID=59620 RepID=UPI0025E56E34|nr:glucosyltransferase domain-containing protein [uncultured Clostridium sp.]
MKKHINKENLIQYLIIMGITLILGNAFLQTHFSSDTYVLYNLGYFDYPSEFFLLDGRIISTLVCYTAGVLHLPYNIYLIGMDFIGICILSFTIYLLNKKIIELLDIKDKKRKILILFATFVLIFNQFTLEYLLFPESAVMCLGVLMVVMASIETLNDKKSKYIKIITYLFITIISYQAIIIAFPVITFLLNFIKVKKKEKSSKDLIIEIIKYTLILMVIIIVEWGIIQLFNNILDKEMTRTVKLINFQAFCIRLNYTLLNTLSLYVGFMNMLPYGLLPLVSIITIAIMFINKKIRKDIIYYIFLLLIILIECGIVIFLFDSGPCPRTNWAMGLVWGTSLIYLIKNININTKIEKIISILVIISFLINSMILIQNSMQHIAANKIDANMGYNIKYKIERYEEKTGKKITKFAYINDYKPSQYARDIKKMGSLTERAFACNWSILEAMNYYTGRKLKVVEFPYNVYFDKMEQIDYTEYTEDQLYFEDNTLYMIIY